MTALEDAMASIYGGQASPSDAGGTDGAALAMSLASSATKKKKHRGLFGGNLLQDVFDVVSLPIAAVTSTAQQASGAVSNALVGGSQEGYGLSNWWSHIVDPEQQIHGSDLIEGNPDKGLSNGMFGEHGVYSKWKPPTAAKIAMGFGLDVAMDPLTYLAPAGKVKGASEAAAHIAETAGAQISKELLPATGGKLTKEIIGEILTKTKPVDEIVKVTPDVALRVEEIRNAAQDAVFAARRGGASNLTAQQLERFGTFTNELGISRSLEKGMNLDFGRLGKIKLTSGEGPVAQLSVLRHKAQMQLGDMLLGSEGVAKGLGKLNGSPELNALARSGAARRSVEAPLSMMDATVIKRLRATSRVIAENAAKDAQKTTVAAIKGFTDDEITAAHEVIDSGMASADARVNELAGNLSAAFEKHGQQLVDAGVLSEKDLLKSGTYFPSPITKDSREALVAAGLHPAQEGGVFNNVKGFIEGKRKLWDPTSGKGGVGQDSETTARIPFTAKTRAEAEVKASKIVAEQLDAAAKADPEGLAAHFLGEHPEALNMMESGKYPLFLEGREALLAQTRAIGRRVAQARAGQKLFEQGYGLVDPRYAKGFVDYGPTADDVSRMLRLGGNASETAVDREAAAREMRLAAKEAEKGGGGVSPVTPPEGPVSPGPPVAPNGAALDVRGSEAAAEARLAADSAQAAKAAPAAAAPEMTLQEKMDAILRGEDVGVVDVTSQVEAQTAAKIAKIGEAIGPVPEGKIRVYNHGDTNWWTQDLGYVARRGDPNDMRYIDVTPAETRAMKAASTAAPGERGVVVDEVAHPEMTKIMQRAKPIKVGGSAEKAANAVRERLTAGQITQNMNAVEVTMDDMRSYLADWQKSARGKSVLGMSEHEAKLREFVKKLQLQEPSAFGYRDPLEQFSIAGFTPTGGLSRMGSPQERINAMEKLLKQEAKNFEAHPDVYAAKVRSRVEGKLAEDAQKAKAGAGLPDTTLVPERRRPFTYEEKQAHKQAYAKVKQIGADRGEAIQDVRRAEGALARAKSAPPTPANLTPRGGEIDALRAERAHLADWLERKKSIDAADAAKEAERVANEAPVGSPNEVAGDNLARWAERNATPVEHNVGADYARDTAQGMGTRSEGARQYLQTDKAVTDQMEQRLAAIDRSIARQEAIDAIPHSDKVTNVDVAQQAVIEAKRKLARINTELEGAKRGLPEAGSTPTHAPATGKMVAEPTPGSAYDKVLSDMHAEIAAKNARAVEPHLESREQWAPGDAPFRDFESGETIKEGTLAGALPSRVDPAVLAKRIEVIKERWKVLGQTVGDHTQLRDAFGAYKGKLDKAIPQSVGRDMNALAQTQVDQVGRLAQAPAHVASAVDDLAADAAAVRGVSTTVIPQEVQIAFDKRAVDGAMWQQISETATASGDAATAEVAHMRIIADSLANDADMYRQHAASWLHEWNSIATERKMHSAVNSLLVQGQIDWLAHTSLQRGILTPQGVAEALQYTERLATPEGQQRLAQSWRKALHWMRVWQITSPGFHVRNLFGGIFNNALAGVDVSTYARFRRLWTKAKAADKGGAALTEREAAIWTHITSTISPGQISSEGLGNPASRLMGEAAVSKTPWGQAGTHGVLPRVSETAGSNVEFYLRGSLMYDTLTKGGSLDDAVQAVNKFHFDYHDSSITEQKLKANVIPFLTWTRHNVPLQLQMMVENPRPYARFAHFKREVEAYSPADKVVPGFFADINAVRLPWGQGGGHNYYVPDLPFRDVGIAVGLPQELAFGKGDMGQRFLQGLGENISQTTPLISGPVEWMLGKQFFKGIPLRTDRAIKLHDLHIPEWLAAPLRLTPLVKRGANGQSYITERDFYIFDKMLPILGRARRLGGSSEKKQQDKFMSHMISFFAGTQIRTNNLEDQKIANYLSTLEGTRQKTINNGLSN